CSRASPMSHVRSGRYDMRRLRFLLVTVIVLAGAGVGEAVCRAGGEDRVTGPNVTGELILTETMSDELQSSGTASVTLYPKRACPVCLIAPVSLSGTYFATAGYENDCFVDVTLRNAFDSTPDRAGSVGGRLAFGGSVIQFEFYET